jgi:hypothetical protein
MARLKRKRKKQFEVVQVSANGLQPVQAETLQRAAKTRTGSALEKFLRDCAVVEEALRYAQQTEGN